MKNFTPEELEQLLQSSAHDAAVDGEAWALMQGEVDSIEDRKNDYLAVLASEQEGKSEAEKERLARMTPDWGNFRSDLSHRQAECLKLKVKYQTSIRRWETCRSLLSSMNTRMRTGV